MDEVPASTRDLLRWGETLAAIARTGLAFTKNRFDGERYEEVLNVAGDIRAAAAAALQPRGRPVRLSRPKGELSSRMRDVRPGVEGYVTPKVAIGAIVGDAEQRILLVQRADSGLWLYPTGWADIGYSAAEVAVKEVFEETGIMTEPVRLAMVLDGLRLGFTQVPLYSLVFQLRPLGGILKAHPLECADVGWFAEDGLPAPLANDGNWVPPVFSAIHGDAVETVFDWPRAPIWRRTTRRSLPAERHGLGPRAGSRYTRPVKADAVVIERVTEVTDELVEVVARLLPQVSSTASAPDRTAL